ncbi:MAG: EAL domain-containing protein [Acetobacteraceae bacterium]|nr:EAL domain-containing protein [Acetobacteraceae bacterium]
MLLVSTSRSWTRAVQSAAQRIGVGTLDAAASGTEAVVRLVRAPRRYSHVLVQPRCSDGMIGALHGLTSGEVGSGTKLVLLGVADPSVPSIRVVPRATSRSVGEALVSVVDGAGPWSGLETAELEAALTGSMIEARYQPIVRIEDGACIGFEALARLNHPAHGVVPPLRFVPQAEDAGLGAKLTEAVARHALAELAGPALDPGGLRVALNLPLNIVMVEPTLRRLDEQCAAASVQPERLVIELTESRPVDDLPALRRAIERFRARGYGLAIDDLGPSVLHHAALMDMPVTAVKLDMGLIRNMHRTESRLFLMRAIERAHRNGLSITAEGIETRRMWQTLRVYGVDHAQGFLISRPLPAKALPLWLDAWNGRRAQLAGS